MRRLIYLLLLLLLATTIVACGGNANEEISNAVGDAADEVADVVDEPTSLECDDPAGCVRVEPGEPIRIASALVISGPNAQLGLDSQYGVEIAMDQRGEVLGHPIELQPEDEGCNAEGGQTAAQKITSDPTIVGVIGTSCSGAGVPASQVMAAANYVMISPSNTAPVLTDPAEHQAGYFRTAHNDKVQGRAMAEYAFNELGVRSAAAIHDGDPYTEGLASVFRDSFIELGGEIVAFEASDPNATDVSPVLTTVAAGSPEFLYYPVFVVLGANITQQARQVSGLEDTILAGADGILSTDFLEAAGDAAIGMVLSGPDLGFENQLYATFLEDYAEKYGGEPDSVFHGHAYDATNILLGAVEEVAIQGDDGTLLIPRSALREAVGATANFEGITGTLTCDEFGDCADPAISVSVVEEGDDGLEFVPVWSYEQ
ncbi:MAG: branched-chain amino acid ABC transporter substrate-binding protein [Anaerolineae bacterium]|nr:branched-chain amino acid ABC transporter substrate-binding protein [Anaerolineae bacterium]